MIVEAMQARAADMTAALARIVSAESPSNDPEACAACADVVADVGAQLLGTRPERIASDGRPHLRWASGSDRPILLLGHFDTVWPVGTLARRPFTVDAGTATGPGVFDMKAGIVQGLFAVASLADRSSIELLLTSDEEVGSPSSRALIEAAARRARAVLVLEPSEGGALKLARKGVSMYQLQITGRAAHAGLEPEHGINAAIELAHHVLALDALARPDLGTTVTPTVLSAGTTTNTVPAGATVHVDVRCSSIDEQRRVDTALRAIAPVMPGAEVTIEGGPNRPPLPRTASAALYERACATARALGLAPPGGVEVGGGSDGNFAAAVGTPTLDGLGPVGAGAHAEHERVWLPAMTERAALLAGLIEDLLATPLGRDDETGAQDSDAATKPGGAR